jgi:hypothetical protein
MRPPKSILGNKGNNCFGFILLLPIEHFNYWLFTVIPHSIHRELLKSIHKKVFAQSG